VLHENWHERVQHILDAIAEIATFIGGMSRDEFLADAKTLKAVTANLTIIGEAAGHIPNEVIQAHPEIPWALMRGMRNRIVHGYYVVDPIIVWETCQNDLAPLDDLLKPLVKESN
jgi:uncharacterized protein with HEPN domain